MQRTPFPIPTWAPAAAATGLLIWAVSIWWMVATLPEAGDTGAVEEGLSIIATETEATQQGLADLTAEVEALRTERDTLTSRLDALEARSPVDSAFELSTSGSDSETDDDDADGDETTSGAEGTGTSAVANEEHALFTDGADRYNCRDFTSYDEAQDALRVNRPGDPNRIDMNDNKIACEDFRYPTPRASTAP